MKLQFNLLVIDDDPGSIRNSTEILKDFLVSNGFDLVVTEPRDLSTAALDKLSRRAGKEFDLVVVDYNLGKEDENGAAAIETLRVRMQFTDIVFYSSDPNINLLQELAKRGVAGVYVAERTSLDESLKGLALTVIGKAVDLNHMRGIAMAEVAEMDLLMEETLLRIFAAPSACFQKEAGETIDALKEQRRDGLANLEEICSADGAIVRVVADTLLFSSANKYAAIRRAARCLNPKPQNLFDVLATFDDDITGLRNILAHAKEEETDGAIRLRAIKAGKAPVQIDEAWMTDYRGKLRRHRAALTSLCEVLVSHAATNDSALQKTAQSQPELLG